MTSLVIASTITLSSIALAEPADGSVRGRAKEAYDRGLEAHKRGDLQRAAEEFARADTFVPSAVALQAALDATIEADDAPLGAELLARSKREAASPGLASSITAAHMKFRGRAGRLRIVCPPAATCVAKVDDKPVEVDKVVWARAGQRTVVVQVNGHAQTRLVELNAEELVEVMAGTGQAPMVRSTTDELTTSSASQEPEKPSPSAARFGLPPIFFYAAVGATLVLAGGTTYFMIDTSDKNDAFKSAGCGRANFAICAGLKDDGETSQSAANIGIVVTTFAGVATTILGIGLTNWKGPLLAVQPGGAGATWRVAF